MNADTEQSVKRVMSGEARGIGATLLRGILRFFEPFYALAQRVLPVLEISNESIKYYASLVSYYSVYKLACE